MLELEGREGTLTLSGNDVRVCLFPFLQLAPVQEGLISDDQIALFSGLKHTVELTDWVRETGIVWLSSEASKENFPAKAKRQGPCVY